MCTYRLWRVATIVALAGVASSVGTAAAQDLQVPEVPDVQLPEVPSVQLPPLPSLPAPQLPELPAPQLPAAPLPTTPSLSPSAPPESGSAAPAPSGSRGTATGDSGTATGGSGTRGGSEGGSPSSVAAATDAARPAGGQHAGARARSGTRPRAAVSDDVGPGRRLRATVGRLRGCLDRLPAAERGVLLLRAGVGPRPVLTRGQVGDRLDVAVPRVARLERRGLRRLRALDRNAGCGGGPIPLGAAPAARAPIVSALAVDALGGASRDAVDDATGSGRSAPLSAVEDAFESSPPRSPATAVSPEDGATFGDPELFLALVTLVMLGVLAYLMARRRALYRL